jgi:hypothetical protein
MQLLRICELKEVPKGQTTLSHDELECERSFISSTTRDTNGRFCFRIPLKGSANLLGDTYSQAERQFLPFKRRLYRAPKYKKLYLEFIDEYIDLSHMIQVIHLVMFILFCHIMAYLERICYNQVSYCF